MKKNKEKQKFHSYDMVQVGMICAVLCIVCPIAFVVPISPVPVSFSLVALYLSVYIVGTRKALMGCGLYLLIGAIGVPVFAGGMAGIGRLVGPTGGYMIGYLVAVFAFGKIMERHPGKLVQMLAMVLGLICLYIAGTAWLMAQTGVSAKEAILAGVAPYVVVDGVKIVFTLFLGDGIKKRIGNGSWEMK